MASDKCWDCPGRGPGGKGIPGTNGDKSDQCKKGLGKQWQTNGITKGFQDSSGRQMQAPRLASQQRAKEKLQPTNSGNRLEMLKVGTTTREPKVAVKEQDGKRMAACRFKFTIFSSQVFFFLQNDFLKPKCLQQLVCY